MNEALEELKEDGGALIWVQKCWKRCSIGG